MERSQACGQSEKARPRFRRCRTGIQWPDVHGGRHTRGYAGEQRFNSTGFLDTAIVTICHTESEDEIHIISMRKAEPHEIEILARYL
ncbi:MAG: BrnT family toxin [Burkholderiales bacterium]|nr:BrnT family toxin [Burkholderiales bacterium]